MQRAAEAAAWRHDGWAYGFFFGEGPRGDGGRTKKRFGERANGGCLTNDEGRECLTNDENEKGEDNLTYFLDRLADASIPNNSSPISTAISFLLNNYSPINTVISFLLTFSSI